MLLRVVLVFWLDWVVNMKKFFWRNIGILIVFFSLSIWADDLSVVPAWRLDHVVIVVCS